MSWIQVIESVDHRRVGHDARVLVVTTATGRSEYRADEVEIHTTK